MNNEIIGTEIANRIENEIKGETKSFIIRPSVAVIHVGSDKPTKSIVLKEEACNRVGMYFRYYNFDDTTPELTIINKIKELNNDDYVSGIMVELPLPEKYNENRLLNTIINSKDVDGLTDINIGRLISGRKSIVSCTALAIIELLKEYNIELENKNVVLIGRSKLVTRPLISLLLNAGSNVTICHSKTKDLKSFTKEADIIISLSGEKEIITEDMVSEKCVIIDAGYYEDNNKIVGDIDYENVCKKVSYITPVPGGVGPMSVAMFLKNTLMCYNNKK